MTTLLTLVIIAVLLVFIRNLIRMKPSDFADAETPLLLEDYFSGNARAWGMFEDRFGRIRRQFTAEVVGQWDGKVLELNQDFTYSDGEMLRREWSITRLEEGVYNGTANDVIGSATGKASGNALSLAYVVKLTFFSIPIRVNVEDWMFLQPDGVLLNRARVSKWGVTLGRVTLVYATDF
ncbi:DUF3833 family protein [Magnetospirillum molischianum]|uniref:Lipoprotein n=1 Tax=Magnetospirillum molischianum DSM 120 TaxID=1150626 RepID=H8FTK5_MAGML|nr:DUF3833 family protein [Magnetospirillum molischianum]CCG41693.1 Lipoprotein [Magnetospirillum molischianum DSM 120]